MSTPYGGPPSGPHPQQPYGPQSGPQPQQHYGPPSGPQPQQPYGAPPPPGLGGPPGFLGQPHGQLAEWGSRFVGRLIDGGIPGAIFMVLYLIAGLINLIVASGGGKSAVQVSGIITVIVLGIAYLGIIGFNIWNLWVRRGRTGQTIGQKIMKIKTIGEDTGQPIGVGTAFLRELCHFLDGIACYIGFLAPLWDEKNQTWADKIVRSVVVRADVPGMPPPGGYPGVQAGVPGGYPPPPGPQPGYGQPQQW